jgi:hypothetical protein
MPKVPFSEFVKNSFARTPQWRWDRASELARRWGRPELFSDDNATREVAKYIHAQTLGKSVQVTPALLGAIKLQLEGSPTRDLVEAYLLCRLSAAQIAKKLKLDPKVVGWYESIFFSLNPQASDWIACRAIGRGTDDATLLRRVGYLCGEKGVQILHAVMMWITDEDGQQRPPRERSGVEILEAVLRRMKPPKGAEEQILTALLFVATSRLPHDLPAKQQVYLQRLHAWIQGQQIGMPNRSRLSVGTQEIGNIHKLAARLFRLRRRAGRATAGDVAAQSDLEKRSLTVFFDEMAKFPYAGSSEPPFSSPAPQRPEPAGRGGDQAADGVPGPKIAKESPEEENRNPKTSRSRQQPPRSNRPRPLHRD